MKIYLAHHYWKDNAEACWTPASFPHPEIETEIKGRIEQIMLEKPARKTIGGYTVFFSYGTGRDAFGREISPVSMAFVPADALSEEISVELSRRLPGITETESVIDLPRRGRFSSSFSRRLSGEKSVKKSGIPKAVLIGISVLAAAMLGCAVMYSGGGHNNQGMNISPAPERNRQTSFVKSEYTAFIKEWNAAAADLTSAADEERAFTLHEADFKTKLQAWHDRTSLLGFNEAKLKKQAEFLRGTGRYEAVAKYIEYVLGHKQDKCTFEGLSRGELYRKINGISGADFDYKLDKEAVKILLCANSFPLYLNSRKLSPGKNIDPEDYDEVFAFLSARGYELSKTAE